MSCSRTLEFCINHSFLLDSKKPRNFDSNFVDKIKSIKPQLELFLNYYIKYNENSSVEFRKSDHKVYIKEFVVKLSQFLNLSCDISFEILSNYLAVDGKLNSENFESMLTRGYDTVSLMKMIGKYYRQERLSLIRLVRYIFCDVKDEWRIIANIIITVSGHNNVHSLYNKIMTCYEMVVDEMSPSRSTTDHWEDISDDDYVLYSLEEQILLLETLLLGTHSMKESQTKALLMNTLRIFQVGFVNTELRISRTMGAKPSVKNILERIGMLQGLVLVEAVCLEGLFDSGDELRTHFAADSDVLVALSAAVTRLGGRRCDGVLMLLTSLLCTNFPSKVSNQSTSAKLAETAVVKLGLFKYLSATLNSEPYSIDPSHCSQLELVVHRAIFDLLSFMCHHIHINSLEQSVRHDLAIVMSELLRPINLYSDVKFLKTGFLKMLEDLSLSFPVSLDMLTVVSSLMDKSVVEKKGGNDIIKLLTEFLDNLPWFCDRRSVEGNYVKIDDVYDDDGKCARSCQLTSQYQPYCTSRTVLTLEVGQNGFFLDDNVVWAVNYGAWDVISAEIELMSLMLSRNINSNKYGLGPSLVSSVSEQFQRLETILDFFSTCIKSNIESDRIMALFCELWALVDSDRFLVGGCEGSLVKMIDLAGQVLFRSSDPKIISQIVLTRNLFPSCNIMSQRLIPNASIVAKAWQNLTSPLNIAIVQAYLRFSLRLIGTEKFFVGDFGIIPPSLIFGSISFVISNLLVDITHLTLPNPTDMADLAINSLIFLNEILGLEPSLYTTLSDCRRERLDLIQRMAVDMLIHTAPAVRTLLSMSSIDVDTLLAQTNVSSQMLAIEGSEQRMCKIVLMALTIVKLIFTKNDEESVNSGANAILDILNSTVNDRDRNSNNITKKDLSVTYTHQYVLSLLELLGYPFGSKITRMALVVLRLIVIHTNVSIIACLGEKTSRIKDLLLKFIGSCDQDQVIRGLVFDFIAECVMCGRHGILQLIFRYEDSENDYKKSIGYQSCLDVLKCFQPEDGVSMVLLVSVSKFLLALWINDCQTNLIPQKNTELWSALLEPLKMSMAKISNYDVTNLELYNFIGNVYGLFAMEIYSSSSVAIDTAVVTSLNSIFGQDLFLRFLEVFQVSVLDSPLLNERNYLDKVVTATTWWKALIFTVLSLDSKSGIAWLSVSEECKLVHKILGSVSNLMAVIWTDHLSVVDDLIDSLISCVVDIVHKRVKSYSVEQANGIINQIVVLMKSMMLTSSFQTHRCHADLLASCSLIFLEHSIDPELLHKASSLTEQFILMLTLRPSTSVIDAKTLVHAITTHMACNRDPHGSQQWVTGLVNSGTLVNCLSLLHDRVKAGDLSLLTQTILTFLIRVSDTRFGANRILQSSLITVMEIELGRCSNDQDIVTYLTYMTQLSLLILQQSGPSANTMAFRFVSAHWERLEHFLKDVCYRMTRPMSTVEEFDGTSKMLIVTASLFDLLWHLLGVKGVWSMHWSTSVITGLMDLVIASANVMVSVLSEPSLLFVSDSAHILRGTSRLMKHVSMSLNSPRKKCPSAVLDESKLTLANVQLQLSSSRLEANVYRVLHSCLMVYSRSSYLASEEHIYSGWQYTGTLLVCDFDYRRIDGCNTSLSFGGLFSLLGSTQHLLRDNLAPLVIGSEKISLDSELIRQTHELCLGLIVSHAICYLSKSDQSHKTERNNFILNMKTELNCYLDGLSKSRRRSALSSNSPISHGPKVTSTPYVVARSLSVGESLDGICAALDSFKKSLDYF